MQERPDKPDRGEPPSDDGEDASDRRATNIFLLVFGVLVVGIGIWLAEAMVQARRADDCLASGRRNCNPIELGPRR
jgi:hypothetical protein